MTQQDVRDAGVDRLVLPIVALYSHAGGMPVAVTIDGRQGVAALIRDEDTRGLLEAAYDLRLCQMEWRSGWSPMPGSLTRGLWVVVYP